MSDLKKENEVLRAELEACREELSSYKNNPAANFYKALTTAIDGITEQINSKTLKIKDDAFVESLVLLTEKSEKIFKGLKEGLSSFQQQAAMDEGKASKIGKSSAKAI